MVTCSSDKSNTGIVLGCFTSKIQGSTYEFQIFYNASIKKLSLLSLTPISGESILVRTESIAKRKEPGIITKELNSSTLSVLRNID